MGKALSGCRGSEPLREGALPLDPPFRPLSTMDDRPKHGWLEWVRRLAPKRPRESARRHEEQFDTLVAGVSDYAIFALSPSGLVTSWNKGAERIKGYTATEIIGQHFRIFYPPEAVERGWPEQELEQAIAQGRWEDEGWRLRKDGSRFWANVVITPLRDASGTLRGFAKITRDLTERKKAEQSLVRAQVELENRVELRTAELASANDALRDEIAARQRLEQELRSRLGELRQADRSKNEFLATLSHELRNPLAPIRNALAVLSQNLPPQPELWTARDVIDRQVRLMTRLVDDLLDVSRITRNALELHKETVELAEVVEIAVETSRPLLEAKGHELAVKLPAEPIGLAADRVRLAQVFSNLLNNAAKFTDVGGHVSLFAERSGDRVSVTVRDDGIGIPPGELARIFDMFVQADRSSDRLHSGLGLGLTIVKVLVEKHGGTIEARSDGAGMGSEFTVWLPIAVPEAAARPRLRSTPGALGALPVPLRILIADDNEDATTTLGMVLETLGARVRTASDGVAALETAAAFRPDVALLDIGMPKLDGFEVARRLRNEEWGRRVVVVAMTGWGQEEDKQRAWEAGFDLHLVKPVDPAVIHDLLVRVSKSAR
jgi:PAS domain S-box-containing protein